MRRWKQHYRTYRTCDNPGPLPKIPQFLYLKLNYIYKQMNLFTKRRNTNQSQTSWTKPSQSYLVIKCCCGDSLICLSVSISISLLLLYYSACCLLVYMIGRNQLWFKLPSLIIVETTVCTEASQRPAFSPDNSVKM